MASNTKIFDNRIWMTTKEASQFLRLSENAFRIYVSRYKVNQYLLGEKSVRYKASELEKLMTLKQRSHK
ncbi:MAG: hypothetical protein ACJAS4_000369 [Bacteriovoracaceae bacterium]|jgi:hypothetical protein